MSIARHIGSATSLAAWLLLAAAYPSTAWAKPADKGASKADRAAAREAYDKATAAFEHGDYVEALDGFVAANAIIPSVQAMYWIAQSQDKLGRVEAAVEAYEAVTARADFTRLATDKVKTVHERLAALKEQLAPPPEPPPAAEPPPPPEPAPAPPPPPPPVAEEPPPSPPPPAPESDADLLPKRNTAELGVMLGTLFISNAHNLVAPGKAHRDFSKPAWPLGVRAAFFPEKVFGVEAEWEHAFGSEADVSGTTAGRARFDVLRAHLLGQYPTSRAVPFALLGAGLIHSRSNHNGADTDFMLELGAGLKVMATKLLVPRLDLRLNISQQKGGGFTDGIALSPEILLGLGFKLGG